MRVVHAHFEYAIFGIFRHPRQAERDADMIIIAFDRPVRFAERAAVKRGK